MPRSSFADTVLMSLATFTPANPDSPMDGLIMYRRVAPRPGTLSARPTGGAANQGDAAGTTEASTSPDRARE